MAANSRLTVAVHVLAWLELARRRGRAVLTSEEIAASVNTNPVVIRRTLGRLHDAGLVTVRRGTGAGWSTARTAAEITLLEVYDATDPEPVFALHATEPNPQCPVGFGIRPALGHVYGALELGLRRELARTTVADVLAETLRVKPN